SQALLAPSPTQPAPLEVTLGETTGAVNSAANIIPDSPGSPENEAEDFSVGTATPLRLATGGDPVLQPFSVQCSAPADAGGSNALVDIMEDAITLQVTRAEVQCQAAEDASTAATQNDVDITNAVLQGALTVPAGRTNADVARTADGAITAFADSAVDSPTVVLGDLPTDGVITADAITAVSNSNANGTTSANTTDFQITNLNVADLLTVNAGPTEGNPRCVTVTIDLGDPADMGTGGLGGLLGPDNPLSDLLGGSNGLITLTLPRGVNLLDPSTFDDDPACADQGGISLEDILTGLEPILTPLIGAGGPLEGTALIIGGGFSEQGDGTFARGLIEAIRINVGVAGEPVTSTVLGRAFTEVNAVRANAVDFSPVNRATPAETIFTNPIPQPPAPEPEPEPEPEEEEEEPEEEEEEEPEEDAEPDPPAEAADEELPFTGLGLAAVAGMGGVMLLGGSLVRRMSGRRGVDSLGDETEQETQ
ncbi:MAG: hypothetical protein H0X56_04975, partial [Solirubrobacterales bacterium]|nr:hypothetical protein [Solirubrobacterales bacterium]